ncbi:MAG TPA: DNA polymerase III subunit gamma/tau [Candidatus Aquilonibacter sp.]|nr:DNA polymerase III subunit gamma/tau [Candidatus Aquilonibacter sp.]
MSYTVLARKYRPQKFSEVIGQEHVTRTLQNALEQGRTAHGYIFSGHRGIGKTTVARILAAALNCRSSNQPSAEPCGICESCTEIRAGNSVDVIEIDAATNRGIDEIRELREAARYRPARDRFKIYILDEAHQITDAAFNALLKTLEEPPDHMVFMLATTQPEDIPQTIRSRCQHFSFRAVKFDDIVGQLRDLIGREGIKADDDALALLAEAGDGSMRDALSILDQAIACSGGAVTADAVRNLVGAAPAHVLEEVMQAVARGASEDVLKQVDRLISEGHSPTHFARQMVRFLRNATVAQIAGKTSSLLQISSEERERVARVAELFSEEDLTRHLQIMLRTHGELGYKQEQRFHLELGLLKMAHAQRLLPLEQLLSDAAASSNASTGAVALRTPARPAIVASASNRPFESGKSGPAAAARPTFVSPFAADSARKRDPRQDSSADVSSGASRVVASGSPAARVVMGATALADPDQISTAVRGEQDAPEIASTTPDSGSNDPRVDDSRIDDSAAKGTPLALASLSTANSEPEASIERLKSAVLQALADANQRILVSMLEPGEWAVVGNEVVIKVGESQTVVDMSLSSDARRIVIASASGVLGRAVKLKIVPGANVVVSENRNGGPKPSGSNVANGRSRAENDAVVRRLQEKFGAQIRTVIDYKERR